MKMTLRFQAALAAMMIFLSACSHNTAVSGTSQMAESSTDSAILNETQTDKNKGNRRRYDQYQPIIKNDLEKYRQSTGDETIFMAELKPLLWMEEGGPEGAMEGTFRNAHLDGYRMVVRENEEFYYCCYYDFGNYEYFTYRTTKEDKDQVPNFMCWEKACVLMSPIEGRGYDKRYSFRDTGVERAFMVVDDIIYVVDQNRKEIYQAEEEEQLTLCSWMQYQKRALTSMEKTDDISSDEVRRSLPEGVSLYQEGSCVAEDFNLDGTLDVLALAGEAPGLWILQESQDGSWKAKQLWDQVNLDETRKLTAIYPKEGGFLLEFGSSDETDPMLYLMEYSYHSDWDNWYLDKTYLDEGEGLFTANQKQFGMVSVTEGVQFFSPDQVDFRDDNLSLWIDEIVSQDMEEIQAIMEDIEETRSVSGLVCEPFVKYQNSRVLVMEYRVTGILEDGTPMEKQVFSNIDLFSGEKVDFFNMFTYEEFVEVCERSGITLGITRRMYEKQDDMAYHLSMEQPSVALTIDQDGMKLQVDVLEEQPMVQTVWRRDLLDWPITDYWDDMP